MQNIQISEKGVYSFLPFFAFVHRVLYFFLFFFNFVRYANLHINDCFPKNRFRYFSWCGSLITMEWLTSEHSPFAVETVFRNKDSVTLTQQQFCLYFDVLSCGLIPSRFVILWWVLNFQNTTFRKTIKRGGSRRMARSLANIETGMFSRSVYEWFFPMGLNGKVYVDKLCDFTEVRRNIQWEMHAIPCQTMEKAITNLLTDLSRADTMGVVI